MTNEDQDAARTDTPLEEQVDQDVGGVQGSPEPDADEEGAPANAAATPGSPPDQPAPDAGEIEWAGQVVKKPPHPGG